MADPPLAQPEKFRTAGLAIKRVSGQRVRAGATGLTFADDEIGGTVLAPATWIDVGILIDRMEPANGWWLADWVNYGKRHWSHTLELVAMHKIAEREPRTLQNLANLGAVFERSRRRGYLSISHHAAVAALAPSEQDAWLDQAEREGLSVMALRDAIQKAKPVRASNGPVDTPAERF